MGNQLSSTFDVNPTEPIASGGPSLLWRIYSATTKKTPTPQNVSLFIIDKKQLEKEFDSKLPPQKKAAAAAAASAASGSQKPSVDMAQILRNDGAFLAKLKHPNILAVGHNPAILDTGQQLVLVTEPVFASLANILGNWKNIGSGAPGSSSSSGGGGGGTPAAAAAGSSAGPSEKLKNFKLSELEMKYGISQIIEALEFMHMDARIAHLNICPENIYITKKGDWKLGGFQFSFPLSLLSSSPFNSNPALSTFGDNNASASLAASMQDGSAATAIQNLFSPQDIVFSLPRLFGYASSTSSSSPSSIYCGRILPNLDFLDPIWFNSNRVGAFSDIFSLGALLFYLFSRGNEPLIHSSQLARNYQISLDAFRKTPNVFFGKLPNQEVRDSCMRLVGSLDNPLDRPEPNMLITGLPMLSSDIRVKTLRYLNNSFITRDAQKKAQFLSELPRVLPEIPEQLLRLKVLPPLLNETKDNRMVVFVLPSLIFISTKLNQKEFGKYVLPSLAQIFNYVQPAKIPLILLENIAFILSKCSSQELKTYIIPFLIRSLGSPFGDVQIETLKKIAQLVQEKAISEQLFKNALLALIGKLIQETKYPAVRIHGLVCLGKVIPSIAQDKDAITEHILPVLEVCARSTVVASTPTSTATTSTGSSANTTLNANASTNAAILMTVAGVYQTIVQSRVPGLTANVIVTKILPNLVWMLSEKALVTVSAASANTAGANWEGSHFMKLMAIVRTLLQQVEVDKMAEMEEARRMGKLEVEQNPFSEKVVDLSSATASSSVSPDLSDPLNQPPSSMNSIDEDSPFYTKPPTAAPLPSVPVSSQQQPTSSSSYMSSSPYSSTTAPSQQQQSNLYPRASPATSYVPAQQPANVPSAGARPAPGLKFDDPTKPRSNLPPSSNVKPAAKTASADGWEDFTEDDFYVDNSSASNALDDFYGEKQKPPASKRNAPASSDSSALFAGLDSSDPFAIPAPRQRSKPSPAAADPWATTSSTRPLPQPPPQSQPAVPASRMGSTANSNSNTTAPTMDPFGISKFESSSSSTRSSTANNFGFDSQPSVTTHKTTTAAAAAPAAPPSSMASSSFTVPPPQPSPAAAMDTAPSATQPTSPTRTDDPAFNSLFSKFMTSQPSSTTATTTTSSTAATSSKYDAFSSGSTSSRLYDNDNSTSFGASSTSTSSSTFGGSDFAATLSGMVGDSGTGGGSSITSRYRDDFGGFDSGSTSNAATTNTSTAATSDFENMLKRFNK